MSRRDIYIVVAVASIVGFTWLMVMHETLRLLGVPPLLQLALSVACVFCSTVFGFFVRCASCDLPINRYMHRFGDWEFSRATLWAPRACSRCGASWVDEGA